MSNGKLKAQYNRVRTSVALQANNMWTNTIGVEADPQAGSNAAIEASLRAPVTGGQGARAARRERAQELIRASGYQPAVTDYNGLLQLAKAQGAASSTPRGACKICGGLGHLTKQCRNHLSVNAGGAGPGAVPQDSAPVSRPLLPVDEDDKDSLSSLDSSLSSSSLGSSSTSSSSSSSSEEERRRRRKRKREKEAKSRKGGKEAAKSKSKKRKKERKDKRKKQRKD